MAEAAPVLTVPETTDEMARLARELIPGGTHSNSRLRSPRPLYLARAEGAYVEDLDGRRYLDCTMGNGAIVLGHGHPEVQEAVRRCLDAGLTTGYESRAAVEAAALMARLIPDFGKVRFANTGTEAVLHAIQIARAATGKDDIAKPEGGYHGWSDLTYVSCWPDLGQAGPAGRPRTLPGTAGLSRHAADTLVVPFNDVVQTERLIAENAGRLAAVLVEPVMIDVGYVPADREYLAMLREATREHNIILIFDELLTGFRVAPGGARELYRITPDLTLYGKALSNGYPLAAVEGCGELLDLTLPAAGGPVSYVGTFNAHSVSVAAAAAALRVLAGEPVARRLGQLGDRLRQHVSRLSRRTGIPVQCPAGGGHFQPYFTAEPVRDYRSAATTDTASYRTLHQAAADRDVLLAEGALSHCAVSYAHTDADVDRIAGAFEAALSALAHETPEI
ncbi:MAG TPA: aminotransferase class III-fold pyridoxal phosphate-dependent enzyme [Streptosporangiaceae bacterium]|nr:aminotransferase class III-fold pyridoxal phosphate-dependent enzyme [Streptosporangiaceae bacterium]